MLKLTEKGRQQVIDLVEKAMTSKYDEILVMQHNNAQCFEVVTDNPYVDVADKAMQHYGCSWRTAEDIVARVVGWISEIDNAQINGGTPSAESDC